MPDQLPRTLVLKDVDPALVDRLAEQAARNGRTIEEELVNIARLSVGVAGDGTAPDAAEQERRRQLLERFQREASAVATPGPNAARSQDFLYDDDGLPA